MFKIFPFLLLCFSICGQDCEISFQSPVKFSTRLSGSFGEPRTRHFHAGIDYKQNRGIPYDSIFSVADGYISTISVQPDGYGKALYINHGCNRTSVYAHLHQFATQIESYIVDTMTQLRTYSIRHKVPLSRLPVRKGQFIGIMGNTGRSSGPHLHFEIRNSKTDDAINPSHVGLKPSDSKAPVIGGIMVYELSPDNQELSKTFHRSFKSTENETGWKLEDDILYTEAIKLGFGIRAYDTMDGASNHNGIYRLSMKVDGEERFSFALDSIPFDLSQYIHSHMDFEEKMNRRYVTKCFRNPGNQLSLYHSDFNHGAVYPFEFKISQVEITVSDFEGNSSSISFRIRRNAGGIPEIVRLADHIRVLEDEAIELEAGNLKLSILPGTFCQPTTLIPPYMLADTINLDQPDLVPLFKPVKVTIRKDSLAFPAVQYVLVSRNKDGQLVRTALSHEEKGTLTARVLDLAKYWIDIDTVSPTIEVLQLPSKSRTAKFRIIDNFQASDSKDDINISVFLDGKWIHCERDNKSNTVWFNMPSIQKNVTHEVKVIARDASMNESQHILPFIY